MESFVDITLKHVGAIPQVKQRKMCELVMDLADLAGYHHLEHTRIEGREDVQRVRTCLNFNALYPREQIRKRRNERVWENFTGSAPMTSQLPNPT